MNYREQYARDGFCIVRGLFSAEECDDLREHYMALRKQGEHPGDYAGVDSNAKDPLHKFPRMIHMHRWDEKSLRWMIDARLAETMRELLGEEVYAVQTMLYFKPPGARGQALHQDQFYLRAKPGTCMAAWLALDDCDEENGCMQLVPGTQDLPILCTETADVKMSFTDVTVPLAEGMTTVPAIMKAGDVLFFNGSVIHGSLPNMSETRFRRSLIGHYITANAREVGLFYNPIYRMDGTTFELPGAPMGDRCGKWVDIDGKPEVEIVPVASIGAEHE